jgi:sugar transferase (PEP-CTERM/EpsH1 system associated)
MARILFLTHRFPAPPNRGDRIRAFHVIEHLRRSHDVFLGALAGPGEGEPDLNWASHLPEHFCARQSNIDRLGRTGLALLSGSPLSVGHFANDALRTWVAKTIARSKPDLVYVFSSAMGQYIDPRLELPLIVDFVDVDAEKWRHLAEKASPPLSWLYALEARRLRDFDRRLADRAGACLLISEDEKRLFDTVFQRSAAKSRVFSNGVDAKYFCPSNEDASLNAEEIVFVGVMDYAPNVDAVTWFAREIFPRIVKTEPAARFRIVGAKPARAVLDLASDKINVTGAVEDVRPYLEQAKVVVAPLRVARGIQNKVLEAMAMSRPVVATPQTLEGIQAVDGQHVVVAADSDAFAAAVSRLLRSNQLGEIGSAARAFVLEHHDWSANLRPLDRVIERLLSPDARHNADTGHQFAH